MSKRQHVPANTKRAVLVEAGHRCAIPTCRITTTEVAHIVPWAKTQDNSFENLIALCPNCHTRYDEKGEIDRKAMRQYKANLGLLNHRYGDVERRVLHYFAIHPDMDSISLPGGMELFLMYLMQDGFLEQGEAYRGRASPDGFFDFEVIALQLYRLTSEGREFVQQWKVGAVIPR